MTEKYLDGTVDRGIYRSGDFVHIGSVATTPDRESTTSTTFASVVPKSDQTAVPDFPRPEYCTTETYMQFSAMLENDDSAETSTAQVEDITNGNSGTQISSTGTSTTPVASVISKYNAPSYPWIFGVQLKTSNSSFAADIVGSAVLNLYAQVE